MLESSDVSKRLGMAVKFLVRVGLVDFRLNFNHREKKTRMIT